MRNGVAKIAAPSIAVWVQSVSIVMVHIGRRMRRLISSDWQLRDNPRDRYRTDFVLNEIPRLVEKYKPDQLLVLGDLTESKDAHPASLVNEIVNFFCSLTGSFEIETVILQGNHDFLHNGHPFFAFMENFKAVHWISKPEILDGCLYLPHTRDYKKDWSAVDFKGHDFIFAHNIFEGMKANGQKLSGIPTKIFPDDAVVISGDVHEPQSFDVVTYVGAPFLCDFGDCYQPRMLLLDGLEMKSIKVKGPQKRVIEVGPAGNVLSPANWNAGDIVKIKVHLEMKDVSEWAKIREGMQTWASEIGLTVDSIVPIVEYDSGERAKPVKSERKTDSQHMDQFAQRFGIDEATFAIGKEIVERA